MNAFLHGNNSDAKDELLDPAKYTADRMDRLRLIFAGASPIKPVAMVTAPADELPEINVPDEMDEPGADLPEPNRVFVLQHLQLFQNPYGVRSPRVMSPATIDHVRNQPLLRRMTTIMDVGTASGELEDGELPAFPLSEVQNRRDRKIPYEPEHNDPYSFSIHERDQF